VIKITIRKILETAVMRLVMLLIKAIGGYKDSEIGKINALYYNYT
jgi:hypothetical protein